MTRTEAALGVVCGEALERGGLHSGDRPRRSGSVLSAAFVLQLLLSASASAESPVVFVGPGGSDTPGCGTSPVSPCVNFYFALENVIANGDIRCVSGFRTGPDIIITKPVRIDCSNSDEDSSGQSLPVITVNMSEATYPEGVVVLRGLSISAYANEPPFVAGSIGIRVIGGGAAVHIEDCVINNVPQQGIVFEPTSTMTLTISDTVVRGNLGGGVLIKPTSPATSRVSLDNVVLTNDGPYGLQAQDGAVVDAVDSRASNNAVGFFAASFNRGVDILLDRVAVTSNSRGLVGAGANGSVRVSNALLTGNSRALDGNVISLGGNSFTLNNADGTFKATIAKR